MRIITEGKIPPAIEYEATCKHCETVFVFEEKETELHKVPYSRDPRECDYRTILCPYCHKEIVVSLFKRL